MKQHYIPRCYLKRFSDNDKCIYAYDKQHSKKYQASLMSVCVEDDMYSISNDYLEKNKVENGGKINRLSIEKDHFATMVEPMFSQLLKTIDEIKNGFRIKNITDLIFMRKEKSHYILLRSILDCHNYKRLQLMIILEWKKRALIW